MKTLVLATALVAASAAPAFADRLICNLVDTQGSSIVYAFKSNSVNANGSFGGTMVEDGFSKNGRITVSPVGGRPIWTFTGNVAGGWNMYPREARGWNLSYGYGKVGLFNHNRFVAGGSCYAQGAGVTEANVGDQGL